jgi:hypothetical protein
MPRIVIAILKRGYGSEIWIIWRTGERRLKTAVLLCGIGEGGGNKVTTWSEVAE